MYFGFLLGSLSGAGAEKSILTLAKALAQRGNIVDILLLHDVFDFLPPSDITIKVLCAKNTKLTQHEYQNTIYAITKNAEYDIFISSRAEFYSCVQSKKKFLYVCITPSAWITTPWWNIVKKRKSIRKLQKYNHKHVIAVSQGVADDLVHNIGVDAKNIRVINDAFDYTEIHNKALVADDTIPPSIGTNFMVCVAALKARKGQRMLLKALAHMRNTAIELVCIGKGEDETYLRKLAQKLAIAHRVHFIGWSANPYVYMKKAKISILASRAEGLPRIIVESLMIKTPVVATNCRCGPNEVLVDEFSQYLVAVDNWKAMAATLDSALEHYPIIPPKLTQRFHADLVAQKYESLAKDK